METLRPAAPETFYERVLDDPRNSQWRPLDGNPYQALWERTAELVPRDQDVVELGCGTGRLAPLLAERSRSYIGVDFAPRLIREARAHSAADFRVLDLRTDPIPAADVYVANEVLEHLDDDLGLLRRLPEGAMVIVSVPSFDSASHVRYFPDRGAARERYAEVLDIDQWDFVPHGRNGRFFTLLRGRR